MLSRGRVAACSQASDRELILEKVGNKSTVHRALSAFFMTEANFPPKLRRAVVVDEVNVKRLRLEREKLHWSMWSLAPPLPILATNCTP